MGLRLVSVENRHREHGGAGKRHRGPRLLDSLRGQLRSASVDGQLVEMK